MNVLNYYVSQKNKKNWKCKIKTMLQTELNSINSLVPWQQCHKYFDASPLQLLFVHLCLKEIFNGEFSHWKAHRVVKYLKLKRMNPSIEHRELMLA